MNRQKMFLRIVGWAENALRLSWGGEKTYSGYLVEQLQPDEKWRKIVWIGDGKLTSCRIENLEPSREYRFRMTPFQFDKSYHEQYMMPIEVAGKTAPAMISAFRGKLSCDVTQLSWEWNRDTEGCVIERKEDGIWKRIARIDDKKITETKINVFSKEKKYEFRIKAFAFYGAIPLYSSYKYLVLEREDGASVRKKGEGK